MSPQPKFTAACLEPGFTDANTVRFIAAFLSEKRWMEYNTVFAVCQEGNAGFTAYTVCEVIIMSFFTTRPDGIAILKGGKETPKVHGEVRFYQGQTGVLVVAKVSNLPKGNGTGFFGFHIHEGGSCQGEQFAETGGHYSPAPAPHPMHAGDLPPLLSVNGQAYLAVQTDRFRVEEILGRTVVIHSKPDDFTSQPAGNAGTKIACGVIHRP